MKDVSKVKTFWCYQRRLLQKPWAISVDIIRCRGHDACSKGACFSVVIYHEDIKPKGASVEEYLQFDRLRDFPAYIKTWFDELGLEFTIKDEMQVYDWICDVYKYEYRYSNDCKPQCTYKKGFENV